MYLFYNSNFEITYLIYYFTLNSHFVFSHYCQDLEPFWPFVLAIFAHSVQLIRGSFYSQSSSSCFCLMISESCFNLDFWMDLTFMTLDWTLHRLLGSPSSPCGGPGLPLHTRGRFLETLSGVLWPKTINIFYLNLSVCLCCLILLHPGDYDV